MLQTNDLDAKIQAEITGARRKDIEALIREAKIAAMVCRNVSMVIVAKTLDDLANVAKEHLNKPECQWKCDDDGIYQTGCDSAWEFTTGTVSDNNVQYCPYCGGQIKEVKHADQDTMDG